MYSGDTLAEINNDLLETRSSLGYVKDWNFKIRPNPTTSLKPYDIHYDILLDMFRNDPVLSTAIDITVDAVTNNSFKFIGKNVKLISEAEKLFFDKFDFDRVIDNILYSLLIFGDAFLELRREGNQITELNPLETTEIFIDYDEHGKIKRYIQQPPGKPKGSWVNFDPDDVIHFKLKWIGSRVYSYSPNESITGSYTTKLYAHNYLRRIFEHMPPKLIYILSQASDDEKRGFLSGLRRIKTNPREDLVLKVKDKDSFDVKELQVKFDDGLTKVIDGLTKEVLMITRVPPIWVGLIQDGNRGTAEALIYPFETRVRKLQSILASDINKKILPKLGLSSLKFKFNPVSFSSETSIIEIASKMRAMGLEAREGDNPAVYYLKEKGIQIPDDTFIPDADEMMERQNQQMESQNKLQVQDDTAPSRQRENKSTDKMTSKLNEKGVSADGKKKMDKVKGGNQ